MIPRVEIPKPHQSLGRRIKNTGWWKTIALIVNGEDEHLNRLVGFGAILGIVIFVIGFTVGHSI